MKKIVGIIAAVAMAASVFAVDFSAGFQLKGNLFSYSDDGVKALDLNTGNSKDDKPFIFSVNGDRAGGQLKLFTNEAVTANDAVEFDAQALNIWFKPFDGLRIDLGNSDFGLNCEQITWWRGKLYGTDDWGFKATYNKDAFEVALFLSAKNAPFFANTVTIAGDNAYKAAYDAALAGITDPTEAQINAAKAAGDAAKALALAAGDKESLMGEMALKLGYNADFGNISAIFDATSKFDVLKFGAGYKGSFGASSIFADVLFTKAAANGLGFDVDYKYSADALTIELYAGIIAGDISNFSDTMIVPLMAKVNYSLNGGALYAKFVSNDVTHTDVKVDGYKATEIEAGYDGNLGAIAYNVALNYNMGDKVFAVPFWVRLSF
jgi:hypothetical protein